MRKTRQRRSDTLILVMVLLAVIVALGIVTFDRTTFNTQSTSRRVNDQEAVRVAEAGIEKSIWCLNTPSNSTDCPGNPSYVGETNVALGQGSYTSTITGSGNSRTIDVISTVKGAGGTTTKHLQVKLGTTTANVSFQYGLQAGVGGLDMKQNNKITGNVFSSGPVTGEKSVITGDVVLTKGSPTLDATADPNPATTIFDFGKAGSTLDDTLAQSFVPTVTDKVYSFQLKVAKHNGPTSTLTAYIYDDTSGNPGTDLTGGGVANAFSTATTDGPGWESGWTTQIFTPSTNPILTAGQTYWLVITSSNTSSTKYWRSVRDADNSAYASGQAKLDGDTTTMPNTCSGSGCDIAFRVNMGGVSGPLKVNCTGVICINGSAIGGNAYAEIIDSTEIEKHACYQTIIGTVKANSGGENCTAASTGPVECTSENTEPTDTPYCHPGNTTLDPVGFPLSSAEIAQMEAQAANGGTPGGVNCSSGCTISSGNIGPEKYNGDVTINGNVGLTGTIWVKGNLTMTSTIALSDAYGTNSGTIIADNPDSPATSGRIIVGNGGNAIGNSNPSTYIMLIGASTTTSDTDGAIDVSNNLTAGVVFTPNGSVVLKNLADLKEVTGQRIVLQNNSDITYETGLASVVFTSGPGGSWIYQRGSYQIID